MTALQVNSESPIDKSFKESTQEPSDKMPPLNANNLAFHAWSQAKSSSQPVSSIDTLSVVFEPCTLEVKDRVSDVSYDHELSLQ